MKAFSLPALALSRMPQVVLFGVFVAVSSIGAGCANGRKVSLDYAGKR